LKAAIVLPEEKAVTKQRLIEHITAAMDAYSDEETAGGGVFYVVCAEVGALDREVRQ
jgi:hypothetical protein